MRYAGSRKSQDPIREPMFESNFSRGNRRSSTTIATIDMSTWMPHVASRHLAGARIRRQ
jgi:hypothetical protein